MGDGSTGIEKGSIMGNYHALLSKSHTFFAEQAGFRNDFAPPPQHVLDRIAEESITGGYDITQTNICGRCFTARSGNGTCFCE